MRDHTPLREVARHAVHRLSPALAGRVGADGRAGVLLQRDLLHLRAGADRFLSTSRPIKVGWYLLPFAAGNFLGPLLLGRLFDTLGRRTMITLTYGVSGVLLALSGYLFSIGALERAEPDHRLDGDFLFCLAGGERGLSHRQRDLSAGSPRAGDRAVLCDRNRHRRRRRAGACSAR